MPAETAIAPDQIEKFIARWQVAEAAERANYQLFLSELCDLLGVPRPDPSTSINAENAYVFDLAIARLHPDGTSNTVYADLYKRGCFILETKQGANQATPDPLAQFGGTMPAKPKSGHGIRHSRQWDIALEKAYNQARAYIRDLPVPDGRPPFLIVCDVGYVMELYSEFTCTGGTYIRFPDPKRHRIHLTDLRDEECRRVLRAVWTDPHSLDPARHSAKVTREVARHLAELAKSLDAAGHGPEEVGIFLQRCLFTMFAEDIGLLPEGSFSELLGKLRTHPAAFPVTLMNLWRDMASEDGWSVALMQKVAYFNGGLFENATALPLTGPQIDLLIGAARSDWSDVEPAIFGTLLERALSPHERHKLGAHYTPRSYVERLVKPAVIDPLRERWDAVKAAAAQFHAGGESPRAIAAVREFHHTLCAIHVLDPACGSGNFLYVTLEHMKRLEGEVLELLEALGDSDLTFEMEQFKVRPQQFHGLEINGHAVAIAQLVLWIGYFQWHKKTTGQADTRDRPLLPRQHTILQQDAVLAYDKRILRTDDRGVPLAVWDGRTTRPHPITGREVPDESAQIPVYDYPGARRAEWPQADFIVGNPPFIGASRMRELLGDGYTDALRTAWKDAVPESADFVMFWWERAAELLRAGKIRRFGFITTNSIHQTFNRRVLEPHLADDKSPLHLAFAIPDHPWVESADGAAVRIAMTVASCDPKLGELNRVIAETEIEEGEHAVTLQTTHGKILANLRVGADTSSAQQLVSNSSMSNRGHEIGGAGFIITKDTAAKLGLGRIEGLERHIRGYLNGKDLSQHSRKVLLIDLYGLSQEELQRRFPEIYQHLLVHVKPERDQNRMESVRKNWWLHRRLREDLRDMLSGLPRYIATVETSKHRFFVFLDHSILPDNKLINIATSEASMLGVLSSSTHVVWALALGGRLGVGNDPVYVKTRCFETFPFPTIDEGELASRIRDLGEQLDAHRKRQLTLHPDLTLTGIYNVLEKLRSGASLTAKEKTLHEQGLITVLKQFHDDLDNAVLAAYGWDDIIATVPLADRLAGGDDALEQAILVRLVGLNRKRATEEAAGKVRWLRPAYQNPAAVESDSDDTSTPKQGTLAVPSTTTAQPAKPMTWPNALPDQVAAIQHLLPTTGSDPAALTARFGRRTPKRLTEITGILTTLRNLGQLP